MPDIMKVLDLFSGMGGFSYGFKNAGFKVTGIDISEEAVNTYKKLTGGTGRVLNLYREHITDDEYTGIIGGPPCRPWSTVNLHKRGINHNDYGLVNVFFNTVSDLKPEFFIMENVPAIRNDPVIERSIKNIKNSGYSISTGMYTYSEFGAAVARKRFFISGTFNEENRILAELDKRKKDGLILRNVIWKLRNKTENSIPGHEWPNLKTIKKYRKYYLHGKYGWRQLSWDSPAPSFGNVMKTYTLHPDFGIDSNNPRVISVLEALRIMGFKGYPFNSGIGKGKRYQMVVDSVSPVFSKIIADVVYGYITGKEYKISEKW